MRFNLKIVLSLMTCLMFNYGFSATCHFKQPSIDTDVCKTLNTSNKVTDNPFFMKNENSGCNVNYSLDGLPDINLKGLIPNLHFGDICKHIKYLNGDQVALNIKKLIG